MKHQALHKTRTQGLLLLGLALLLLGPGPAWGVVLVVTQPGQQLYPQPDLASPPLVPVPVGTEVTLVAQSGDWYQVKFQDQTGWLHSQAFTAASSSKFSLPGMLLGKPVQETKSDEVALAGKGFNPQVEAGYRQKYPNLNFAQVDKIEAYRVDQAQMQAFIAKGGLTP